MVIYYLFIDLGAFGSYNRHSILDLIKDNSDLIYKEHQENISNKYVSIFGNFK